LGKLRGFHSVGSLGSGLVLGAAWGLSWPILQNVLQYYKCLIFAPPSWPSDRFSFSALLAASLCRAELPAAVASRLAAAEFRRCARRAGAARLDRRTLLAHNAERSLAPASTLKLLTSLAALETLGPAYRGRTELLAKGEAVDGVPRR
jgi:D-alanyl-D-alanine carboxypeptidase